MYKCQIRSQTTLHPYNCKKMTYLIFAIVMMALAGIAMLTGLSYNSVNILAYYLALPLIWAFMTDRIIGWRLPWISMAWLAIWLMIFILTSGRFQAWCDVAFDKSVNFLLWFKHWGWDYYRASVYICVWVPIIVTIGLSLPIIMRHPQWHWQPWAISFVAVALFLWIVEFVTMTYATTLQPHYERTEHFYALSYSEQQKIAIDTQGMTAEQIVKYADRLTSRSLTFTLSPNHKRDEGSCVEYSAKFTAIANCAFRSNGIKAIAKHNVGTIKMFGMDLCHYVSTKSFVSRNAYYRNAFSNHDFVTIHGEDFTYHYDPTISSLMGYTLKTKCEP